MKALIRRDLILLQKIPIIYKLIFSIYIIVFMRFSNKYNFSNYESLLLMTGSVYSYNSIILLFSSIIVNGVLVLLTLYLYTYDFKYNPEFIFLKISRKKWLLSKYISLFFLNLILFTFIILIYFVPLLLYKNLNLTIMCNLFIILINKYFLQCIFLTLVIYFQHIVGTIIFFGLILSPIILKGTIFKYLYVEAYGTNVIYIILFMLVTIIISYFINYRKILRGDL